MPGRNSRTVYSTDPNFKLCPRCGNYPCRCRKPKSLPPKDQIASILRERKGRGGKTVTVISNFVGIGLPEKEALAKTIQKACGTGGTVKEGRIEIQGDKREEAARILAEAGFKPVFAGG